MDSRLRGNDNHMNYDVEANLMSWEISKGEIDHAIELGNFIIHVSPKGKPILIEILEASKFVGKFNKIKNLEELPSAEESLT